MEDNDTGMTQPAEEENVQYEAEAPSIPPQLVVVFAVVFVVVAIPLGIFISKKMQPTIQPSGANSGLGNAEIIEDPVPTPDANGCITTCKDECKRADNCRGPNVQGLHCGWTKTKPVIEKKWCNICVTECQQGTESPTVPSE